MKPRIERLVSAALAALLAALLVLPALAENEPDVISISSAKELAALSKSCTLDTFSQGKTIRIEADMDLAGSGFSPIPTFGGTFEGQGHTISGLEISDSVSIAGLFCYVQQGAIVRDIKVEGEIEPSGTQRSIGGLAGENSGKLINCSFSGAVAADSAVGGLVGVNQLYGEIYDCSFEGFVSGEHYTGGIAGENFGVLSGCVSGGSVNTVGKDPKNGLEEMQSVEEYLQSRDTNSLVNTSTDTGGIAGYSGGVLLSCENTGTVGYPHIGYNVGGVAGRSDGFINGCKNSGEVMGRKDVGGVAGQLEPDVILNFSGSSLSQLQGELNTLSNLINRALDDVDASSATISNRFTKISGYTDTARDSAKDMTDTASDFIDANIAEIDRGSAIVADVLDRLSPILDKAEKLSPKINDGLEKTEKALDELAAASDSASQAIAHTRDCVADVKKANERLEAASKDISDGIDRLRDAVVVDDMDAVSQALTDIGTASGELSTALADMNTALTALSEALEGDVTNRDDIIDALRQLAAASAAASAAMSEIAAAIQTISNNVSFDSAAFDEGMELISKGFSELQDAAGYMDDALDDLELALRDAQTMSDELSAALSGLADAVDVFKEVSKDAGAIVSDISDLTDYLAGVDPIQLVQLGEDFRKSSDELYAAMTGLSGEMEQLNREMKNASDTLTRDLRAISDQFMVVMNLFIDAIYDKQNVNPEDYIEDTSEENIESTTVGKALECENSGPVSGDVNVGGVAGSMAVEYDFDPEDDLKDSSNDYLNAKTETKAILQRCINRGVVTAKKDCVGAIVGLEDLGLVTACEGYGSAESTGGDYVGGIAGQANSAVRGCFAKAGLSGGEFVGGIVGSGKEVTDCLSLVRINDSVQFAGAVSGNVEGSFSGNRFVSDTLAGIDRFSYAGKAEPISYEELSSIENLPDDFRRFSVSFKAGDKTLSTVYLDYKGQLSEKQLPAIPEKEGCYARWDAALPMTISFDEVISAVYTPYLTALSSPQKRADGQSVILVEGQFTDESQIDVKTPDAPASAPEKASEFWQVSVSEDGLSSRLVRFQPDAEKGRAQIYTLADGAWHKEQTESFGGYLCFETQGSETEFAVVYSGGRSIYYIAGGGAVLLLAAALLLRRKAHKPGRHEAGKRSRKDK